MSDSLQLKAPNGEGIQGTYELVPGAASVTFCPVEPRGYDYDGGSKMFWDGSETQKIEGVPLFTDEAGNDWLQHHLIPENAEPIDESLLVIFREEIKVGEALRSAREFLGRISHVSPEMRPALVTLSFAVVKLETAYQGLRETSIAELAIELAKQGIKP